MKFAPNKKEKNRARSGQALVEALVAISALSIGFLGIFTLLSQSFSLNRTVSDTYAANYLAAEGIEVVKNLIDTNIISGNAWNLGLGGGEYEVTHASIGLEPNQNRTLSFDATTNLYGYSGLSPTPFRRRVTLTQVSGDELQVVSQVSWSQGGGSFDAILEEHFYRWR